MALKCMKRTKNLPISGKQHDDTYSVSDGMDAPGSVANLTKGCGDRGGNVVALCLCIGQSVLSNTMTSVRAHGLRPKARSTSLASPTMPS